MLCCVVLCFVILLAVSSCCAVLFLDVAAFCCVVSLFLTCFFFLHLGTRRRCRAAFLSWDFGKFFVIKESLALMYKELQLPSEALLKYQVRTTAQRYSYTRSILQHHNSSVSVFVPLVTAALPARSPSPSKACFFFPPVMNVSKALSPP